MRASIMLGHSRSIPSVIIPSILFFHSSCHRISPCTTLGTTNEVQPCRHRVSE